MKTYCFSIILDCADPMPDDDVNALYGIAQDCSVMWGDNRVSAMFDREADTLDAAIKSAVADVRKVGYEPKTVEIDTDGIASVAS